MIEVKIFETRKTMNSLKDHQDKINKWAKRHKKIKVLDSKLFEDDLDKTITIFLFETLTD